MNGGNVLMISSNDAVEDNVEDWNNMVVVSASYCHIVGLRSDRTVTATGDVGQCELNE